MTIDPKNLGTTAKLTFADEFNALSLRTNGVGTWMTNYWWGQPNGNSLTGNGEEEWYINHTYGPTAAVKPWTISNGILTLTGAKADPAIQPLINGYKYTSGMINSYGSFTQLYGYFEIRCQLPKGKGVWPAFWLLPADGSWPPEIDIFEVLGHEITKLYTTVHTNVTGSHTSSGSALIVSDMSAAFHTYGADWQQDFITFYFDGNQVFQTPTPADLHKPHYIIANLALGGYWPGMTDSTTPLPAKLLIDYIRAYSALAGGSPPPAPPPPPPSIPTASGKGVVLTANDTAGQKLVGGAGDDELHAGHNSVIMTGGGGADTFFFDYLPWAAARITDFQVGVDKLDLSALLKAENFTGADPVDAGLVMIEPNPSGTQIQFKSSTFQWPYMIVILEGVSPVGLTYAALVGAASAPAPVPPPAPAPAPVPAPAPEPAPTTTPTRPRRRRR